MSEDNQKIIIKHNTIDKTILNKISEEKECIELDILLLNKTKLNTAINIIFDELEIGNNSPDSEPEEEYIKRKLIEVYKLCKLQNKYIEDLCKSQEEEIKKLKRKLKVK